MPKAKPTQVITHRIELGAWERENLGKPVSETAQAASMLSSLGVAAIGAGAVAASYALWKFWGVFDYAKEKVEGFVDTVDDITTPQGSWTDPDYSPGPIKFLRTMRRIFSL